MIGGMKWNSGVRWGRWIWRDLRAFYRVYFFLLANLSLGLVGFLALDAFKTSLDASVQLNAKNFLSADLSVSARRLMTETELTKVRKFLPQGTQETRVWEFFSMVNSEAGAKLINVKAIGPQYPFYGQLKLGSGKIVGGPSGHFISDIHEAKRAWVYPELLVQLGLKVGDQIDLGGESFTIADTVADDSTQTFRLASLAPRVYVGLAQLTQSQLIQRGTTLTEAYLFRLLQDSQIEPIAKQLNEAFDDTAIRIETPAEASQDTGRALGYLSDYLGLVSLVALFLAAVGTAFLFRGSVATRLKSVAILNSLGMTRRQAQWLYLLQLMILGCVSAVVALVLAQVFLPLLSNLLNDFSPVSVDLILSGKTALLAIAMGVCGSFMIGWPFLRSFSQVKVAQLFQEEAQIQTEWRWQDLAAWVPSLVVYYGLAVWQANSLKIGSVFVGSFTVVLILLLAFGWAVMWLLARWQSRSWIFRHSVRLMVRKKWASLATVVALGLGATLMTLIPQLRASLQEELEAPKNIALPSLFLFDIQDEQLDPLVSFLATKGYAFTHLSPMVRARLLEVNGQKFEKGAQTNGYQTREEETEARFRNRGFNLSYRSELADSEILSRGVFSTSVFRDGEGHLPEISIEERFAERLKLQMADVLKFDIQGVQVEGKITSFRKVKWNSFQPNFFLLFQDGVLNFAPKTFLGSLPQLPPDKLNSLQSELAKAFPNISMVDVGRVVKRVFEISEKMSWSLELMAALSLLAGFVILFSMVNYQTQQRRWDLNLFKILGADSLKVQTLILFEFGVVALVASVMGVIFSIAMTYLVSYFLFEGLYGWDPQSALVVLLGVPLTGLFVAFLASRKVVLEKPSTILQSSGT